MGDTLSSMELWWNCRAPFAARDRLFDQPSLFSTSPRAGESGGTALQGAFQSVRCLCDGRLHERITPWLLF